MQLKRIGIPSETKVAENRVGMSPDGVNHLTSLGAEVLVQVGAGSHAGFADEEYGAAGATLIAQAADLWERSDLIVKVKEPQGIEQSYLRNDLAVFAFLHLPAYASVAHALMDSGTTGIAYETVQLPDGSLPLLAPMSEVAGKLATQVGAQFLQATYGGSGTLIGGIGGVPPARVVVIGAGTVGMNAAYCAVGLGAHVTVVDRDLNRLRSIDAQTRGRIETLASTPTAVHRAVMDADVVVGAALSPADRAPVVVTEDMIVAMKPGSVVVDVAIDQGGCIETSRETTHDEPTFVLHDVVHYCVGNMPGAVPRTSTIGLTNATLPYVADLVMNGVPAIQDEPTPLYYGVNVHKGEIVHPSVRAAVLG